MSEEIFIVFIPPGIREDLRSQFCKERRESIFGQWEGCAGQCFEERDSLDNRADYLLAIDEDERIYFGIRVLTKTENFPLPIERYLPTSLPLGTVEVSRALKVRYSSPLTTLRTYLAFAERYTTAPGAYASIRESYLRRLPSFFRKFSQRVPGKIFEKGGNRFIPVRFDPLIARQVLTRVTKNYQVELA